MWQHFYKCFTARCTFQLHKSWECLKPPNQQYCILFVSTEWQVRLFWIIHLQEVWFGVLHHVCGEHKWAEGECRHSPEETPSNGKTYLKKSSKALAALRKVVLDKKWLSNLAFYVRFRFVSSNITNRTILLGHKQKLKLESDWGN